jgi:hypothetical protein
VSIQNSKNPPPIPVAGSEPDPFDVASRRLSQDFTSSAGVVKVLTTVPVRKPDRQWFVRVNPDPAFRVETAVLELKEESETYLVAAHIRNELPGEIVPKLLLTAMNRQGTVFLWPIRMPDETGRLDEWNRSALVGAKLAEEQWVRISSDRSLGAYGVSIATGDLPEPEWPDKPFKEILRTAFRDRFIEKMDHPVVLRLRGRQ